LSSATTTLIGTGGEPSDAGTTGTGGVDNLAAAGVAWVNGGVGVTAPGRGAHSVLLWFRLDLRARWRSLLVLALLVAFASGTVLAAVAGARRGASAAERLAAATLPASIVVLPNQPGFDWDAVRALPEVAALSTFVVGDVMVVDGAGDAALGFPPGDDDFMRTIERPIVLEGRPVDPDRADEVVVTSGFTDATGLGVGDTLTMRLFRPETIDEMTSTFVPAEPDGPVVEAAIVGVVRSPWLSDVPGSPGGIQPSPGLFARYRANLLGTANLVYLNAHVRLRGGEAAITAFQDDLARVSGRTDIDYFNQFEALAHTEEVTGFEADALVAFAVAAGIAATFLVGQSITRYSWATVADLQTLRALGFDRRQTRVAAVAGPALAATAGAVLGAVAAVVASRWFPVGSAAGLEPSPGFDVDWLVLGAGLVAVPLLASLLAFVSAWTALRPAAARAVERGSRVAGAAAEVGAPVPVVVGARFALEPGRGRRAVPVRPALAGAVVGVLGVVAAFTFSNGVSDAARNPARFGQVYELQAFLGLNGEDFVPADDVLPVIAGDPDVVAANDSRSAVAESNGVGVAVFSFAPVGRALDAVVTEGRMPAGPGEVALAPRTADALGVGVGDAVDLVGTTATRSLSVTGLAFVPEHSHNDYATGAWVTRPAFDEMFDGFKFHTVEIAVREDADPAEVAARLGDGAAAVGVDGFEVGPPFGSMEALAELRQVERMPLFLAAFLAVLALGAVGHAVSTAVRRRRHDVAVLRALGLTRRQCRGLVASQASILAGIGLLVGVPVGIVLGRVVWRYVAETTPLFYVPPLAWSVLVLIVPVVLLAANLLAVRPSRRAASMRIGQALRVE
jgi:ABC-type lipoprotein release transport system permease subunit